MLDAYLSDPGRSVSFWHRAQTWLSCRISCILPPVQRQKRLFVFNVSRLSPLVLRLHCSCLASTTVYSSPPSSLSLPILSSFTLRRRRKMTSMYYAVIFSHLDPLCLVGQLDQLRSQLFHLFRSLGINLDLLLLSRLCPRCDL